MKRNLSENILNNLNESNSLDKEKYNNLMLAIEDIVASIGNNEEQLNDLINDVNNKFNKLKTEKSFKKV